MESAVAMGIRRCQFPECSNRHQAKGWCSTHYAQWHSGRELTPIRARRQVCSIVGCGQAHDAKGLCGRHYRQECKGGFRSDMKPYGEVAKCSVTDCDLAVRSRSLCAGHYERSRNGISFDRPLASRGVTRGTITLDGYRRIRVEGASVLEHRHVMECYLGRPLLDRENVHHINGDRQDNRIENLELWYQSQPSGQRIDDLIEYVAKFHTERVNQELSSYV